MNFDLLFFNFKKERWFSMCLVEKKKHAYSWSTAGGDGMVLEIPASGRWVRVRFKMRQPVDRKSAMKIQQNFLDFLLVEILMRAVCLRVGICSVAVVVNYEVRPTHAQLRLLALCAHRFASTIRNFTPPSREKIIELFSQRPNVKKVFPSSVGMMRKDLKINKFSACDLIDRWP